MTHLGSQLHDGGVVLAVVLPLHGPSLLDVLSDLDLQLAVGLLQIPHRLQVASQAVVQVLHGYLLVSDGHDSRGGPSHPKAIGSG